MQERRSIKKLFASKRVGVALSLKNSSILATMTIPAGWTVSLQKETFRFFFQPVFEQKSDAPGGRQLKILHFDPYFVRQKFLSVKEPRDAIAFFQKFGPLDVDSGTPGIEMIPGAAGKAHDISFSSLLREQDLYSRALLDSKFWNSMLNRTLDTTTEEGIRSLREMFRLNLLRSPKLVIKPGRPPYLLAETAFVSEALYSTIYFDKLTGLSTIKCPNCGSVVRGKNKHKQRRYCSEQCAAKIRKQRFNEKQSAARNPSKVA